MILTDIVLIFALLTCLFAWWRRGWRIRQKVLLLAASLTAFAGLLGVYIDRWQSGAALVTGLIFLLALLIAKWRNSRPRGRKPGKRVPWISGSLFTLLGAFSIWLLVMFPMPQLPSPGGPYAVGTRSFELDDASRKGLIRARPDEARRLLVRVWYPTENTEGISPRAYFTELEAGTTAADMGANFLHFRPFFTYIKYATTNSHENAPLLGGAADLPAIFYSHGYGSFAGQNTALMEHLASHGYVVYSVHHTYDAAAAVFPNGDVVSLDSTMEEDLKSSLGEDGQPPESVMQAFTGLTFDDRLAGVLQSRREAIARNDRLVVRSASIWTADRLFVLDQLQAGAVPEEVKEIAGASNLAATGQMGMSFGGSTTGRICAIDPRCVAGVNLDGGDFHFDAFNAEIPVPFLMFYSDTAELLKMIDPDFDESSAHGFNDFSYETFGTAGERGDVHRVYVKGATHLGVSDFSLFMRRPLRNPLFGSTPADVMIGSQNEFVRGFFDKYLRGTANDFPATQLAMFEGQVQVDDVSDLRQWWLQKTEAERAQLQAQIREVQELGVSQP